MTTLRHQLSRPQGDFMSLTIPQLIGVFWRRKWIIGTTLFVALCIAVIANGVITPRYTATASVIVEPRQQNVIEIESVMSSLPVSLETMQSEVQIIQSPTLARQVIDGLGLAALAEFNPALLPRERSVVDEVKSGIKGVFRPIIAWLKEEPAQPRAVELAEAPGTWDLNTEQVQQDWGQTRIVNRFLGRLNLAIQGSSRVISISYTTGDPALSQQIANAVAEEYIRDQVRLKNDALAGANTFLSGRIAALRADVQTAENAVEEFRATTPIISERDGELMAEQIFSLSRQELDAQLELDTVNERLDRVRLAVASRGQMAAFEGVESTVINSLRLEEMRLRQEESELLTTLGVRHPSVVAVRSQLDKRRQQMVEEARSLVSSLQNEKDLAQQRVSSIQGSLRRLQGDSDTLSSAQIELRALQREAEATREVFESFLNRYKETEQIDYDQAQSRVLALASIPTSPSFPRTRLNYALAVVLGCGLGALIILLLELSVRGYRDAEEVQTALGLPVLAVIPRIRGRSLAGKGLDRFLSAEPNSAFAEAHKSVYAALRVDRRVLNLGNVLLVTSSVPNEGKSVFSRTLTASLARAGMNVLLIDADLRASEQEPRLGLSDFVLTDCPLEQAIEIDEGSTLSVIPPGTQTVDPLMVLRSQKLTRFVRAAGEQYDLVCIDAPPTLAVSDAATLAELADQVVMVVRWSRTPKQFVQAALERLRKCKAHVAGTVMTQAQLSRSAKLNPYTVGYADRSFRKYY